MTLYDTWEIESEDTGLWFVFGVQANIIMGVFIFPRASGRRKIGMLFVSETDPVSIEFLNRLEGATIDTLSLLFNFIPEISSLQDAQWTSARTASARR